MPTYTGRSVTLMKITMVLSQTDKKAILSKPEWNLTIRKQKSQSLQFFNCDCQGFGATKTDH